MGYEVSQKSEMWTDNAAALYEEAIQRRWKAATDIDWASIPAGPAELDRARAQVLTIMAEQSWVQSVTYGAWLKRLSYGYYEVKLFLATVVFALGRHTEAFRKRAMLHGGGVGMQGTAGLNREIIDARNFTEMILINQLMADSFTEVLLGRLAADAPSPAEARLYTLARQDRARALAFGQARVRDALAADPSRIDEMHAYLQGGGGRADARPEGPREQRGAGDRAGRGRGGDGDGRGTAGRSAPGAGARLSATAGGGGHRSGPGSAVAVLRRRDGADHEGGDAGGARSQAGRGGGRGSGS